MVNGVPAFFPPLCKGRAGGVEPYGQVTACLLSTSLTCIPRPA